MDIELLKLSLHFLDVSKNYIETVEINAKKKNIIEYIDGLIDEIIDNPNKRLYRFKSGKTQVKSSIDDMVKENPQIDEILLANAERLLEKEVSAETRVKRMGRKVQRGSLLHIHFKQENNHKILICKIDHDEIITEKTFEKSRGLNTRKKIFKSFLLHIEESSSQIYLNDKNNSKYWWSEFLELEQVNTDDDNTEKSINKITSIIDSFKKKNSEYLLDSTILRNYCVGYFRSNENFNFSEFMDSTFYKYQPYNEDFPLNKITDRINKLSQKEVFDNQFKISPEKINKKIISEIRLSPGIFLKINDFVQNLDSKLMPYNDTKGLGMTILSDEAYSFVKYKIHNGK